MASYSLGPDGLVRTDVNYNLMDGQDGFSVNGFHVRRTGGHSYETSYTFDGGTGGYPTCANKLNYYTLGFIQRGGASTLDMEIHDDHRGMTTAGYYGGAKIYASCHGDGIYFRVKRMGGSGRTGLLLPGSDVSATGNTKTSYRSYDLNSTSIEGTAAEYVQHITAIDIGDSELWDYLRLCVYHYPHCGADRTLKFRVKWRGGVNGFIPKFEGVGQGTYTAISSAISNGDSNLPTMIYTSLPSGVDSWS